jgi:hypothetical protein
MSPPSSTFRRLVNPQAVAALQAELEADRARFRERFDEYGRMREELESLSEGIERQEKVLGALRSALPADGQESSAGVEQAREIALTKREIAAEILKTSIQPLFPREVREIAVKRGLIPPTRAAANQLSVAMSKGARSQIFVRDREGRYSLPDPDDVTA